MAAGGQTIYLIKPKLGGLANNLQVTTEDGQVLYHVKSKAFSPSGRAYIVYSSDMVEYMTSQQDHTAIFPRHSIFHETRLVAKIGQDGLIPLKYYIQYFHRRKLQISIGVFSSIFLLQEEGSGNTIAEMAQHRDTWIVALANNDEPAHILPMLAIIFRETSIGG
ncbi:MAG: hypothetical protein O3A51_06855 [Verrucomicrobia bacterium]|nr:hypothetical protein [Verrucomicrobiota bacterium]